MRSIETDVVVVSAGTAGLAAAATAAELGKRVVAVERNGSAGGNGNLANGPMAVESRIQRMWGYTLTCEQAYEEHMRFAQWDVDGRLVKKYIDRSAETIDWLERLGIRFSGIASHGVGMNFTWHTIQPESENNGNKNGGYLVVRAMEKRALDLGAEILFKTVAKRYIVENDRVVGVVAEDADGELEIRAGAVISCTGGYGAYWRAPMGIPLNGDGLRMAREVGAEVTEGTIPPPGTGGPDAPPGGMKPPMNLPLGAMPPVGGAPFGVGGPLPGAGGPPPAVKRGGPPKMSKSISCFGEQPNLVVNCLGERFVDEYTFILEPLAIKALLRQPGQRAFSIFDREIVEYYQQYGFDVISGYGIRRMGDPQIVPDHFDEDLDEALSKGQIYQADSVEELAEKIGVPAENLRETLDSYNACCASGYDSQCGKRSRYLRAIDRGPYYAVPTRKPIGKGEVEGITINSEFQVLTPEKRPVKGLYAAGMDTARNIWKDVYVNILPGNAFGWAINSGRMAAESAVERMGKN